MAFISLGSINKNIIFLIIACLSNVLINIELDNFDVKFTLFPNILSIIVSFSLLLSIFPFLILKKNSKTNFRESQYIEIKKIKYQKFALIIINSFFDFIQIIIYAYNSDIDYFTFWIFDIMILTFFSYFILKIRLYKHQYFSIVIIIFINITLIVIQSLNFNGKFIYLFDFILEILDVFFVVIDKYILDYKFCSPYELCFYNGLISLILNGLFSIYLLFFTEGKLNMFPEYFNIIDYKEYIKVFIFMLLYLISYLFYLFTIKNYSPFYYLIILVIEDLTDSILNAESNLEIYIISPILLILFFIILVFNEIIILKCFGLDKGIKIKLQIEAERENQDNLCENEITDSRIDIDEHYAMEFPSTLNLDEQ